MGGGWGGGVEGGSMRDLGKSTDHLFLTMIGDNDRLKYLKVL